MVSPIRENPWYHRRERTTERHAIESNTCWFQANTRERGVPPCKTVLKNDHCIELKG
jgi:hypothetical protein